MENGLFSKTARVCALFLKYLLYLFNLALLGGLGVKTVNLWIARPFDFSDMVAAFPAEPEFLDKAGAEKQFLAAAGFETAVFVLGGFLCYELLIKQKSFRRGLIAPMFALFLWATGESVFLFFPATEKAQDINVCRTMNISWDTKNHRCRLMDLELRRFEKLKAAKKKRPVKKALPPKPAAQPEKTTPPAPVKATPEHAAEIKPAAKTAKRPAAAAKPVRKKRAKAPASNPATKTAPTAVPAATPKTAPKPVKKPLPVQNKKV